MSFLAQTSNVGGPVSWSFDKDADLMHIPHFQFSKSDIEKQIKIKRNTKCFYGSNNKLKSLIDNIK